MLAGPSVNDYAQAQAAAGTARVRTSISWLKARAFVLTFIAYAIYSGTRQPFGITKAALSPDHDKDPDVVGYAPFNSDEWGSTYLGACDTTFLAAYAVGLFITGPMGDRVNLRWFLGFGMMGAGVFCFLFGAGALFHVHNIGYFLACNLMAGLFQATGWPAVVTLMTRWFGQGNRGTIMGVWNAHSSVGNIIGKLFATAMMHEYGWQYAFMGSGTLCFAVGLLQLAFIIPQPSDVLSPSEMALFDSINSKGLIAPVAEVHEAAAAAKLAAKHNNQSGTPPLRGVELDVADHEHDHDHDHHESEMKASMSPSGVSVGGGGGGDLSHAPLSAGFQASSPVAVGVASPRHHDEFESISFGQALRVPGVLEYSICLFFSKLVAYAFIFWLPFYLSNLNYSDTAAGNMSTVYDMGGVAGGILAGWASDVSGKRGLVSGSMLLLCLPGLWLYSTLAQLGIAINIILMFIVGILVNGPYTLISSAVAADLGNHPSLKGNPKAMSTVTGIIDGAGSVGAALQGVIIGLAGKRMGWSNVFYLLMGFCFLSAMTLQRIVKKEVGPTSTWRPISQWCSRPPPIGAGGGAGGAGGAAAGVHNDEDDQAHSKHQLNNQSITGAGVLQQRLDMPRTSSMSDGSALVGTRSTSSSVWKADVPVASDSRLSLDNTVASGAFGSLATSEQKVAAELRAGLISPVKAD